MRSLSFFLMLSFFISGCSGPISPTPIPTMVNTPRPTSTSMPFPTLTATPTADPNRPFDATGQDPKDGRYTKTLNGTLYYWVPLQFTTADSEQGVKGHWFLSRMAAGPINLTEGSQYDNFTLPLDVYFIEDYQQLKQAGYLARSKDYTSDFFPSLVIMELWLNFHNMTREDVYKKYNVRTDPTAAQRWYSDMSDFIRELNNGAVIKCGAYAWQPRKGYRVYFINYDEASNDPSFYFTQGIYSVFSDGIYWKPMVLDGQLTAVVATKESDKISDEAFRRKILLPLDEFVHGPQCPFVPEELSAFYVPNGNKFGVSSGTAYSINGNAATVPFIEIVNK